MSWKDAVCDFFTEAQKAIDLVDGCDTNVEGTRAEVGGKLMKVHSKVLFEVPCS